MHIGALVDQGEIDKTDAVDDLNELGSVHDLFRGGHAREELEHVVGQALRGVRTLTNGHAARGNGADAPSQWARLPINTKGKFTEGFVPPDYLIEGILQRRFMYALTGPVGHAKTAIALHICELVAAVDRNLTFSGRRIRKGRALYFVGENADDIRMRVIGADSLRSDDASKDQMYFIVGVFNIGEMLSHIRAEIERIGPFDFIVVDTSAAYFLGNEELSNTQMGHHARMLRQLTELPGGPCVLVLCHPIKHAQEPGHLLPRGGGAFLAEVDGNLTVWRKAGDVIELSHNKMRGPGFDPISFRLDKITTTRLVDAQGRLIPTVRAVPITQAEEETKEAGAEDEENQILRIMLLAKPEVPSMADIGKRLDWTKAKVQRAIERIKDYEPKLIRKKRNQWILTELGEAEARSAGLRTLRPASEQTQESLL